MINLVWWRFGSIYCVLVWKWSMGLPLYAFFSTAAMYKQLNVIFIKEQLMFTKYQLISDGRLALYTQKHYNLNRYMFDVFYLSMEYKWIGVSRSGWSFRIYDTSFYYVSILNSSVRFFRWQPVDNCELF